MIKIIEILKATDYEILLRLVITAVLGLALGIERELRRKSLGLRTILVISIVSCILTIVSIQSSYLFPASINAEIRMDPLRLAAQIVSGVGFLGAGVILRRGDDTVSGLTTAAIVWGAAGIGIATGAGFYIEAIVGVTLILLSVRFIPTIINKLSVLELHVREFYVRITLRDREDIKRVIEQVEKSVEAVENVRIKDLPDNAFLVVLLVTVNDEKTTDEVYQKISMIDKVGSIEIRS